MAEEEKHESSQKTEEPTERRLEEARERGNTPISRELNHWLMIAAATLFFAAVVPSLGQELFGDLRFFIANAHSIDVHHDQNFPLWKTIGLIAGKIIGVMALIFWIGAILGTGLQTKFRLKEGALMPKLSNLSPKKGLQKIFSVNAFVEFLKSTLKIGLVGLCMYYLIKPEILKNEALITTDIPHVLQEGYEQILILFGGVLILMGVLGGADYAYQYFKFLRDMRMSREEIKEEHKTAEGDPHMKQKIKAIRKERLAQKLTQIMPNATVVLTNPTHYSVALQYVEATMNAPVLIAKGADHMALHMRLLAKKLQIPILQDPSLTRTLYETVKIGEEIQVDHYKAVAKIIQRVFALRR